MDERLGRLSAEFLWIIAMHLGGGRVQVHQVPIQVVDEQSIGRRFKDTAVLRLPLRKSLLGLQAFGNILAELLVHLGNLCRPLAHSLGQSCLTVDRKVDQARHQQDDDQATHLKHTQGALGRSPPAL